VAELIATGHATFDLVDEFAESTWSDIRGNGSEAQRAADEAQELWERAAERNTMQAQEFAGARDDLDAADALLARAEELVGAISTRLRDLEAARAAARDEIGAAAADIAAGQEFVRAHDPDISPSPDQRLRHAAALLAAAGAEASQPKPDWLALLRNAQAANAEADAALAGARSEFEAMEKLRGEVQRARQVAAGEVQKNAQFYSIHAADIRPQARQALAALQQEFDQADAALAQAQNLEDTARKAALEQALGRYTALHQQADQVYVSLQADFARVDKLRDQLEQERQRAQNTIDDATRTLSAYNAVVPNHAEPVRLLERANSRLRAIGTRLEGEDTLRAAITAAETARRDAQLAEQMIRQSYSLPQTSGSGDAIAGALIGALLEGAARSARTQRRNGGSWGGGLSRGRDSGWGGRGSSFGGSWGGGSSSKGSWGGGSSSKGGW
jgi:hypothetical protein